MLKRLLPFFAFFGLLALPLVARSAPDTKPDKKTALPSVVLRVQSIDELLANFKYLAHIVGRDEDAKKAEDWLMAQTGPKGLEGIDTKRPLGAYAIVKEDLASSTVVVLIPISDEKSFLELLEKQATDKNITLEKGKDGIYNVDVPGLPTKFYFRFAHKHAYITFQDAEAIAKDVILTPAQVLPVGKEKDTVLSLTLHIDQLPEETRKYAVSQVKARLGDLKEEKADAETKAQHELKVAVVEELTKQVVSVIEDGGALALRLNLDRKANDISLELALGAKEDSKLGGTILELGKAKSSTAGLISPDSVMNLQVNMTVPEHIRKLMGPAIDEAVTKGLSEEKDATKKALVEKGIQAILPTVKAGVLDMAVDFRGPGKDQHYTLVSGLKVSDGANAEKLLREVVKGLPENEHAKVTLDVAKEGTISIHQVEMKDVDEDFKKTFGSTSAYVAVRSDVVFMALGEDALPALKGALKTQSKVGKPAQFEISAARLAELAGKEQPEAAKAAAKAFGESKQGDKIRFGLESGKELKVRISMDTQVLKFFSLMVPNPNLEK
jgi:hypothetical protein